MLRPLNQVVLAINRPPSLFTDANKSRILIQALLLSLDRVPRSLVVSRGIVLEGTGCSWAVLVYILNRQFLDTFLGDEDPAPVDTPSMVQSP